MEDTFSSSKAIEPTSVPAVRVKIIGLGGAGTHMVERLRKSHFQEATLAVVDTDASALEKVVAEEKVLIGKGVTRGLSAGADAAVGAAAAKSDMEALGRLAGGQNLVFLLAGLGGGTGSGAAPVLAAAAVEQGAMVAAFVTMPFSLEGGRRTEQANKALAELRLTCEVVVPIYNDILMQLTNENATVLEAFAKADDWVRRGIYSLCTMLFKPGLINVDFSVLRGAFPKRGGQALFTLGAGEGKDATYQAVNELLNSPLLGGRSTHGPVGTLVVNILSGPGLTLPKVSEIVNKVTERFGGRENTVLGAVIDPERGESLDICVIGSSGGFHQLREGNPAMPEAEIPEDCPPPGSPVPPARNVLRGQAKTGRPMTIGEAVKRHIGKRDAPEPDAKKVDQVEMDFDEQEMQRSFFEKTRRTMIDGQDVDIPTYLRRGIKIIL